MRHCGFSRWELLALGAVSCLAVSWMASACPPKSSDEDDYDRDAMCMSNLKKVALGLHQYMEDYDDEMPRVALNSQAVPYSKCYGWADATVPYLKTLDYFQCPAESRKGQDNPMQPGFTAYWLNTNMSGTAFTDTKAPTSLIMLGDGDGGASNSNARYNLNKLPKSWIAKIGSPARRHQDKACYAFFDGHVKRVAPSEVGKPNATFALK
jgi:prepilin-type processing-associated H-X9-DG protein